MSDDKDSPYGITSEVYQDPRHETEPGFEDALLESLTRVRAKDLIIKAKALVDAVSRDDSGIMVGGQWVAGNGGLLSRETIASADALCLELDKWK